MMYSVVFQAVAVTAAQDLISLLTPSGTTIRLHAFYLGQSSDAGDAQDELLRVRIQRGMTTVGSGGTSPTPVALDGRNTVAAGCTARVNDTTAASAGTIVQVHEECFNVRAGYVWIPTPEMRPTCGPGVRIAFNLPSAPADSLTMSGTLIFEEF